METFPHRPDSIHSEFVRLSSLLTDRGLNGLIIRLLCLQMSAEEWKRWFLYHITH